MNSNKIAGAIIWLGAAVLFIVAVLMFVGADENQLNATSLPLMMGSVLLAMLGALFLLGGGFLLFKDNEKNKPDKPST